MTKSLIRQWLTYDISFILRWTIFRDLPLLKDPATKHTLKAIHVSCWNSQGSFSTYRNCGWRAAAENGDRRRGVGLCQRDARQKVLICLLSDRWLFAARPAIRARLAVACNWHFAKSASLETAASKGKGWKGEKNGNKSLRSREERFAGAFQRISARDVIYARLPLLRTFLFFPFSLSLSISPPLLKSVCISRYVVLVAIYNPFIVQICISDGEREGIKIFLVTDGIGLEKHLVASGVFPFPAMMSIFRS